jgi:hypothetical protein
MHTLQLTVTSLCIVINAMASFMNAIRPNGEGTVQAWCLGISSVLWLGALIYQVKTRYD